MLAKTHLYICTLLYTFPIAYLLEIPKFNWKTIFLASFPLWSVSFVRSSMESNKFICKISRFTLVRLLDYIKASALFFQVNRIVHLVRVWHGKLGIFIVHTAYQKRSSLGFLWQSVQYQVYIYVNTSCWTGDLGIRVAESEEKYPTPTPNLTFPKFPNPTPDSDFPKFPTPDADSLT